MINRVKTYWGKNSQKGFILADQGLISGVNFLMGILLARFLGAESFGIYAIALMLLYFVASLQQAFIIAPMYSLTARQENKSDWLQHLWAIQLIFSLLTVLLLIPFISLSNVFFPEWKLAESALMVSAWISLYALNDFIRRRFLLEKKVVKALKLDAINYGLQPLAVILLFSFGKLDLNSAFAIALVAQLLSLSFYLFTEKVQISFTALNQTLTKLWQYSRYLLATAILQWSSGNYFIIVAAAVLGPIAVGIIRISQNLMGLLNVLFLALENMVPAKAAEVYHQKGLADLQNYFKQISKQAAVPTLSLIGLIAIFHKPVISLVYGETYAEYAYVLLAFCGIYVLVFMGTMLRFVIRTLELNQIVFWSYVATTVFSLLTAKDITATYGIVGVISGIAGTQLITLLILIVFLKLKVKWNLRLFTLS